MTTKYVLKDKWSRRLDKAIKMEEKFFSICRKAGEVLFVVVLILLVLFFIWIVVCALFQRPGQPFSFSEAIELTRNFISQIVNG